MASSTFRRLSEKVEFVRIDGDFAFVMGLETLEPIADAPSAGLAARQTVQRRFTNIWKKEASTWRLFARLANVMRES